MSTMSENVSEVPVMSNSERIRSIERTGGTPKPGPPSQSDSGASVTPQALLAEKQKVAREEAALEAKLMAEAKVFKKRKEERIMSLAAGEGIKWGVGGATTVGAATVLATMQSAKFNRFTQISAKVSLPVMAGLFFFTLKYELAITNMNRNPHLWEDLSDKNLKSGNITYMPVHHRMANFLYDHPFGCVAGFGVPFAAYILKTQLALKHITFSQRIMHSRVFAQGGILTMGMAIMGFREYMNKRGRFPELSRH